MGAFESDAARFAGVVANTYYDEIRDAARAAAAVQLAEAGIDLSGNEPDALCLGIEAGMLACAQHRAFITDMAAGYAMGRTGP